MRIKQLIIWTDVKKWESGSNWKEFENFRSALHDLYGLIVRVMVRIARFCTAHFRIARFRTAHFRTARFRAGLERASGRQIEFHADGI
jgi:hypothetical protein